MKVLGELEQAQLENLAVAPTNTPDGLSYFNTATALPNIYTGASFEEFLLSTATQTITNKTIVAGSNTISGLLHGTHVDNTTSGVHGAVGTIVGTSDTQTLTNKVIDSDSNTITNIANADVKALAGIVESKLTLDFGTSDLNDLIALSDGLTPAHAALTTTHGVTGDIVGTEGAQTIISKVIDADNNTITNLAHGSEVDNPTSGVHGVTGNLVGDADTQTLTNKTIVAGNNTISGLLHGTHVDNLTAGVHGVVGTVVGTSDTQTFSNKTFSDKPILQDGFDSQGEIVFDLETNNVATGASAVMTAPTKGVVKLTNVALTSIDDIDAGANEQIFILINTTGSTITINNNNLKIITGTGVPLDLESGASLWLEYDNGIAWRVVGGSGSGGSSGSSGAGFISQNVGVLTASTGTFGTVSTNRPILTSRYWDNALTNWTEIDPSSLDIKSSSDGSTISYDTTTLPYLPSDFLQINAIYPTTSSISSEYDTGWIAVTAINNLPSGGFHRVDLPSVFTQIPAGYTLTIDDGTDKFPGDYASQIVFDDNGGTQRVAIDTKGLDGTDLFRFRSSIGALPVDSDAGLHIADATIHFTEGSIDHTAIANIGTNAHSVIDTHIADATKHFTEASIDHTAIANIGTNAHSVIDTHLADSAIHTSSKFYGYYYDFAGVRGSTRLALPRFPSQNEVTVGSKTLITPQGVNTDGIQFLAAARCLVTATYTSSYTGTGEVSGWGLNAAGNSDIDTINIADSTKAIAISRHADATDVTCTLIMEVNDILSPNSALGGNQDNYPRWKLTITAVEI